MAEKTKLKYFDALSLEDLRKMHTAAKSEMHKAVKKMKGVAKYLFSSDHYLVDKDMRYDSIYNHIFLKFVNKQIKSNLPYIPEIVYDSKNLDTPIYEFAERINGTDSKKNSNNPLDQYEASLKKNLEILTSITSEKFADNESIRNTHFKLLISAYAFGNSCIRVDKKEDYSSSFTFEAVELDKISIVREKEEVTYFFNELTLSFEDCLSFFTEEDSINQIRSKYSDIEKPESRNEKKIRITEFNYCCPETQHSMIKYALHDEEHSFLEVKARNRDYKLFHFISHNRETNETYGKPIEEVQVFLDKLDEWQKHAFHKNKSKNNIVSPEILDISGLSISDKLETNYEDGVGHTKYNTKYNDSITKNYQLDVTLATSFGGNLNDQVKNHARILEYQGYSDNQHAENIQQALTLLGFTSLEIRDILAEEEKKLKTKFELREQQALSTPVINFLRVIEKITATLYSAYIDLFVNNFAYHIKRLANQNKINTMVMETEGGFDSFVEKSFNSILTLDQGKFNKELDLIKKHPFGFLSQREDVIAIREEYNVEYNRAYNEPNIETKERNQSIKRLKVIENDYNNLVKDLKAKYFIPIKQKEFNEHSYERLLYSFNSEQINFFLGYRDNYKKIKFSLASSEMVLAQNVGLQTYETYFNKSWEMAMKALQAGDQGSSEQVMIVANLVKNRIEEAEILNISDKILTEKQLENQIEERQAQRVQEQAALAESQESNQSNPQ